MKLKFMMIVLLSLSLAACFGSSDSDKNAEKSATHSEETKPTDAKPTEPEVPEQAAESTQSHLDKAKETAQHLGAEMKEAAGKAKEMAQSGLEKAKEMTASGLEKAKEAADKAKEMAQSGLEKAKEMTASGLEKAKEAADKAKEMAQSGLEKAKEMTASGLNKAKAMMKGGQAFKCDTGLAVKIKMLDNDQVSLTLDDKEVVLKQAVSASGERYVAETGLFGHSTEWHQKGEEAVFSFTDAEGKKVEGGCKAE